MSSPLEITRMARLPSDRIAGFVGFPKSAKQLLGQRSAKTLKGMIDEGETIVARLCASSSLARFKQLRDDEDAFVRYWRLNRAISEFVSSVAEDESLLCELQTDSLDSAKADFEKRGPEQLGTGASREALFVIGTLKRVHRLLPRVRDVDPPKNDRAKDEDFGEHFGFHMTWSLLHLNCLELALKRRMPLEPSVQEEILAGSRQCVMAYSYLRQALELREKRGGSSRPRPPEFDDEDRELAAASTKDLETLTPMA